MKYLLGLDIGSSSIKAVVMNAKTGEVLESAYSPNEEMYINSTQSGFAEQDPEDWWAHCADAVQQIKSKIGEKLIEVAAIGISYQMHGLVLVDKEKNVLHPAIIWCDSRAVESGNQAAEILGRDYCLSSYLNLPGNFTISKLKWVKENRPDIYNNTFKFMLPGDFIAMKLTGEIKTTISGLSEGVMWNFDQNKIAYELFGALDLDKSFIPEIVPTFGNQGHLTERAAKLLGMKAGIPIAYRAGDQPNNAFSLNVLREGEAAATAGTSGVVYVVSKCNLTDQNSRVNSFAHVNYTPDKPMKGILLCINGTGILYRWLKSEMFSNALSYDEMNLAASDIPAGAEGVMILPFGNGAERILNNQEIRAEIFGLDFNRHLNPHLIKAALEGIGFSFRYGLEIIKSMGAEIKSVKVGMANLFLNREFAHIFSNICNVQIDIFNTDGSQGAARGAGLGCGIYKNQEEAFKSLQKIETIKPRIMNLKEYNKFYETWISKLVEVRKQV